MTRQDKVLRHINRDGIGIEVGPSYHPIAPRQGGFKVHVIDHMTRTELLAKFKNHAVPLENIEDVDFVWRGQSYAELTGKRKYYDWIIASHVIEHTPDLIRFLRDCDEVMKEDAVLSLVIPDKRQCFDHFRPISGIGRILDGYFQGHVTHTPGTVAEHLLHTVSRGGEIAWDPAQLGPYQLLHTEEQTRRAMDSVVRRPVYHDVHAWCFTPHSFRLLIHDLYQLGLIALREVCFFPTAGCEFFVTLGRSGTGSGLSRLDLLRLVRAEQAAPGLGRQLLHRGRKILRGLARRCGVASLPSEAVASRRRS